MTSIASRTEPVVLTAAAAEARLAEVRDDLLADRLIPYLGPDLLALAGEPAVPILPETVAAALHGRAPAPARIRTNMWSVAQFIEQRRHRRTLVALMSEIFAPESRPTALHRRLADLPTSLVIDTWYDGTMRAALVESGRGDWIEIQGATRAGETRDVWTRTYDPQGNGVAETAAEGARTLLYAPHGSIRPAQNFLVADSDYVEVMTEIDIQSPIPAPVQGLRSTRGFLYLGCRFHDQMLRTYARQIAKRAGRPSVAVADPAAITRNEAKFFAEQAITVIDLPLARAVEILVG